MQLVSVFPSHFKETRINNLLLVAIAYSTWSARRNAVLTTPSALNTFHADNGHLGLATIGLAILGYASYMGGALVYKYGMGIQRQGSALELKDE